MGMIITISICFCRKRKTNEPRFSVSIKSPSIRTRATTLRNNIGRFFQSPSVHNTEGRKSKSRRPIPSGIQLTSNTTTSKELVMDESESDKDDENKHNSAIAKAASMDDIIAKPANQQKRNKKISMDDIIAKQASLKPLRSEPKKRGIIQERNTKKCPWTKSWHNEQRSKKECP